MFFINDGDDVHDGDDGGVHLYDYAPRDNSPRHIPHPHFQAPR